MTFNESLELDHKVYDDTEEFGIVANIDGVDIDASMERDEAEYGIGQFIYKMSFDSLLATVNDTTEILSDGVSYAVRSFYVDHGRTFVELEKL